MILTQKDYTELSAQEAIPVPALKAIKEVESQGNGHLADGRPKILFEGHKFYQHLRHNPVLRAKVMEERPDLCFEKWTKAHYRGGAGEWLRIDAAIQYDREAALKSASWGAFQIMGENHALCGFKTVQEMVNAMFKAERFHLEAVCRFIKSNRTMHQALLVLNWDTFARHYNGPAYKMNQYHIKLARAYSKHSKSAV